MFYLRVALRGNKIINIIDSIKLYVYIYMNIYIIPVAVPIRITNR